MRLFCGVHDLQAVDVLYHAVLHFAPHRTAIPDHIQLERRTHGQRSEKDDDDCRQDRAVNQYARAPGATAHFLH
ncbi:hypothetical protein D3C77_757880 [compost metagenome]